MFDEKDIEIIDIIFESSSVETKEINQINDKNIYFCMMMPLVDIFKKKYWKNISDDNYEMEIIKEIFKSYFPKIDCIFYKNSVKYFLLYVDVETLSLLMNKVTNDRNLLNIFFRHKDNEYIFILNMMINNNVFKMFEDEILQNIIC